MNSLIKKIREHEEKFNEEPIIIGVFWQNPKKVFDNIKKAIETNKPYNEYNLLSDEEKKAFDKGELLF